MKKLLCLTIAVMLVLSSVSALAAGVAPVTGESNIKCDLEDVSVKVRTVKVSYENANFDAADDVTFLFYAPESAESDNIIDTKIYHADQVDFSADGYTFTLSSDVPEGTYNLLIGGTDEDVPCLVKGIELGAAVTKGNIDLSEDNLVNSSDLLVLARYVAKFDTIINTDSAAKEAANVTNDAAGAVDSADLLKLARYVAKFAVDLNAEGAN